MRAGDIFKFAHMSVFVTSISVGVVGLSIMTVPAAYAQVVEEFPSDEEIPGQEIPEEEMPEEEVPEEEVPEEEMPEEEIPEEEMPEEEMPEEEVPEEEFEEPQMDPREAAENVRDVDHPEENLLPPKKKLVVKSDRSTAGGSNPGRADPAISSSVAASITGSGAFCDQLIDERYKIDCMGERLLAAARAMPATPDYQEARQILIEAGEKIRALARANQAPAAPVARAVGKINNTTVRTRPLVPVAREKVRSASLQAANILQEAETKLLRAAEASDRRLIAYAQIAKAVGSNKKLLRSA